MATAGDQQTAILDLSFLTEEERAKIESVLRADEELRTRDRIRIGTLRQDIERQRHHQKQLVERRQCTHCEVVLGIIFNSGAHCPVCLYRVCKQCRVKCQHPPPPFLCTVCFRKRLLDLQAADYISSTSFSPVPAYGTELVRKSLRAAYRKDPRPMNPYSGYTKKRISSASSPGRSSANSNYSNSSSYALENRRKSGSDVKSEGGGGRGRVGAGGGGGGGGGGRGSLGSQSVPDRRHARKLTPNELTSDEEEGEEDGKMRKASLVVPDRLTMSRSESQSSLGSLTSMYSAPAGKGDYQISGEVFFGVYYAKDGILKVNIGHARNLAATRKEGYSYPYVKTYLLPDRTKQTKRKTGFVRRTLCPKYDETLKYKIGESDLSSRTLWLSVWDWDRFGRNQFLGEVRLPLSSLNLTSSTQKWYPLRDMNEQANEDAAMQYCGQIRVGLMFDWDDASPSPTPSLAGKKRKRRNGKLHVTIQRAEDLPKMDAIGLTDATVKCYLLPVRASSGKRKTRVVKGSIHPVWDQEFTYSCSRWELRSERVLEVTVWDYDKRGSNDFIGGLRLGPAPDQTTHPEWMDSFNEEASHWEEMLEHCGEWVEQWHTLRPSMGHMTSLPEKPTTAHGGRELSPVVKTIPTEGVESGGVVSLPDTPTRHTPPPTASQPQTEHAAKAFESIKATPTQQNTTPAQPQTTPTSHRSTPLAPPTSFARDLPLSEVPAVPDTLSPSSPASLVPEVFISTEEPSKGSPFGSQISLYSVGEIGRGNYDITGEVLLSVHYMGGQLLVDVSRARDLAAADSNGFSDPYIKTYLLPDKSKHSKRKTKVQKKTVNPVYDQTLEYKIGESDLSSRTLWLSVWDWDRFGRNQFLGEVRLPLSSLDLTSSTQKWYPLDDKREAAGHSLSPNRGEVELSLKYVAMETTMGVTLGNLLVKVKRAENLVTRDNTGAPDAFVNCKLLPNQLPAGKQKTSTVRNSSSPSWDERFTFDRVPLEELARERVLEISIWDGSRDGGGDFVGGLHIGPAPGRTSHPPEWMDCSGVEVRHWEGMLARPGEWCDQKHVLRANMEPPQSTNLSNLGVEISGRRTSAAKEGRKEEEEGSVVEEEFCKVVPRQGSLENSVRSNRPPFSDQQKQLPLAQKPEKQPASVSHARSSLDNSTKSPKSFPEPTATTFTTSTTSTTFTTSTTTSSAGAFTGSRPRAMAFSGLPADPSSQPIPALSSSKKSNLLHLKHGGSRQSFGSQLSIYSLAGGGKGNYDITGEVLLGVYYRGGQLSVDVDRARDLAAADSNGFSDPYVKTYLLPDKSKHSKKKTDVQRKTLNPIYNQTLSYKIGESDLSSRILWLSVWDWDRFGRNQFLGEVRLPLSSLDLASSTQKWYTLMDKEESTEGDDFYHGQLNLALRFSPTSTKRGKTRGNIQVIIKQGKDLPRVGSPGHPDPFVKCYLLPDKSSGGKRKVGVVKNSGNPTWETQFSYEKVALEEIANERVLEVTVWDWDKKGSSFIGGLRLGPPPGRSSHPKEWMDGIGEEVSHWEGMLAHPGEWVQRWHTLRSTMDYRNVAL